MIETVSKQGYRLKQAVIWNDLVEAPQTSIFRSDKQPSSISSKPCKRVNRYSFLARWHTAVIGLLLIILVSITGNQVNQESEKNTPPSVKQSTRLDLGNKQKRSIRFSPDGEYLAYTELSDNGSGNKIYLYTPEQNFTRQIPFKSTEQDTPSLVNYQHVPAFPPMESNLPLNNTVTRAVTS